MHLSIAQFLMTHLAILSGRSMEFVEDSSDTNIQILKNSYATSNAVKNIAIKSDQMISLRIHCANFSCSGQFELTSGYWLIVSGE